MELTELKDYMGEEELSAIAQLLVLEDESFRTIAPVILNSIQDQVKTPEYLTELIQQLNGKNLTARDLAEEYQKISGVIDESSEELTEEKKDFLKQIFVIIYNSMIELVNGDLPLIQIPIELCSPDAKIPTYAHEGDAGMDVYSTIDCTLAPGESKIIPLGFKVAIPEGYELQVRPRSGFSAKTHLRVANAPGTIDAGYRAEVGVILYNSAPPILDIGDNDHPHDGILYGPSYTISKGDRIAQLVLQKVPQAIFIPTSDVSVIGTNRNGGWGSTGK